MCLVFKGKHYWINELFYVIFSSQTINVYLENSKLMIKSILIPYNHEPITCILNPLQLYATYGYRLQ